MKSDKIGNLTFGSGSLLDVRNVQVSEYVAPEYELDAYRKHPNHSFGVFAQYERSLGKQWVLFAGLRLDESRLDPAFLSPKLAAVWKSAPNPSYKFMYGRSFRNPSTYERFWEPNMMLQAERMNTFEVSREQRILNRIDLITSVFHYKLAGLVEGVLINERILQYRNVSTSRATGFEVEVSGSPVRWMETAASFSLHRARYVKTQESELPNSPERLAQLRASVPLARNRLLVSTAARYLSSRLTPYGFRVDPVYLADITATTNRLHRNFDLQFGVRNIADRRFMDPVSEEHSIALMPRAGRSVFFKLIWRYGE